MRVERDGYYVEQENVYFTKSMWDKLCQQYQQLELDKIGIEFEDYLTNLIARGCNQIDGIIQKPPHLNHGTMVKESTHFYPAYLIHYYTKKDE